MGINFLKFLQNTYEGMKTIILLCLQNVAYCLWHNRRSEYCMGAAQF